MTSAPPLLSISPADSITPEKLLPAFEPTPIASIPQIVNNLRAAFNSRITFDVGFREKQLRALYAMIQENKLMLLSALNKDLRKSNEVGSITELAPVLSEIFEAVKKMKKWVQPEYPAKEWLYFFDTCVIEKQPVGTVCIIAPWNYPVHLVLSPLVGAIAAGCCAVIKPSEVSPTVSAVLSDLLPKYLDQSCYACISGGIPETTTLLECTFDHIFYTGNGTVAKIVMRSAVNSLCPVTLELGGKSPCFVHDTADPYIAAKRIAWGKFLNCGQTCIAPDFIITTPKMQEQLIVHLTEVIRSAYGNEGDFKNSKDYSRIVNSRHFKRLTSYIDEIKKDEKLGRIVFGGEMDENDLFISPTVIANASWDAKVMQDEIFGPILPIIVLDNLTDAIVNLQKRDTPLALYVFSKDKQFTDLILSQLKSGGATINDTLMHAFPQNLPLGGAGASGMGSYHGKASFDTFTQRRPIMKRSFLLESMNNFRYPPFTQNMIGWMEWFMFKKL